MKKILFGIGLIFMLVLAGEMAAHGESIPPQAGYSSPAGQRLSIPARRLLERNGFVVIPGSAEDIAQVYSRYKEENIPVFVTTDAVLHTSHLFFDTLLRILELERHYPLMEELTERMIELSRAQADEANGRDVGRAARLNTGFFSVARKILNPDYETDAALKELVEREIQNIEAHAGMGFRPLLEYVKNPSLHKTPYAYEDYSQYVPRGHYTRNDAFKRYFKAMMWYGRIDFKLKPMETDEGVSHGRKMTLQAILIAEALRKDARARELWSRLYRPTAYFVGRMDDLNVEDYIRLIDDIYGPSAKTAAFADRDKLDAFITRALRLRKPGILSGAAFAEDGVFGDTNQGFRFIGQRFIPDSYIFQELVFHRKNDRPLLKYTGTGKPFTMEIIPVVGPVRAFPRGLDVMAVLGSGRARQILEKEGDTEYTGYDEQLDNLRDEFSSLAHEEWTQNLYWRWLHSLRPLLFSRPLDSLPLFMRNRAWEDKRLYTALGSWAELRHDTILYAKQSYTMATRTSLPPRPVPTLGYVEPCPEVYSRLGEMMRDLRENLTELDLQLPGVPAKIAQFEEILSVLETAAGKEIAGETLSRREYDLIWSIGAVLSSLKRFPPELMRRVTSDADDRMDVIADVHTDINSKQVLEEGVGSPFEIYVMVEDREGQRLCGGAVFSTYEFKHPMDDRLTDEKWQQMGNDRSRPDPPEWTKTFVVQR